MAYKIEYTSAAFQALRKLPHQINRRIIAKIESLSSNPRPHGSVKISGHDAYRIRVGDYRIIYAVADERLVVLIVEIGHRREVYRGW